MDGAARGIRADRRRSPSGRACMRPPRGGSRVSSGATRRSTQLARARDRARAGYGQLVAVVGEPGVGKSRLYWEFIRSHLTEGWLVLESTSVSYGKATAYLPVIDLLRAYFKIEERDEARVVREKVTGKLLTLDENLRPALARSCVLLGAPGRRPVMGGARRRRATAPDLRRHQAPRAAREPRPARRPPVRGSALDRRRDAGAARHPRREPADARVLLLVNYRPEYRHAWGGKSYYTQLRIDPLGTASAAELLDGLLGASRSLEPLKRLLLDRTEGNPFFLEESVRTLVESGVLVGERGSFRLARALDIDTRSRDRPGRARRAHRSAAAARQAPAPVRSRHRQDGRPHAPGDGRRDGGARAAARACSAAGRRVPLRDEPVPGARVHVQARADARGRVPEPAARAAAHAARGRAGRARGSQPRTGTGQRGGPRPSCRARRIVGTRGLVSLPRRCQGAGGGAARPGGGLLRGGGGCPAAPR